MCIVVISMNLKLQYVKDHKISIQINYLCIVITIFEKCISMVWFKIHWKLMVCLAIESFIGHYTVAYSKKKSQPYGTLNQ